VWFLDRTSLQLNLNSSMLGPVEEEEYREVVGAVGSDIKVVKELTQVAEEKVGLSVALIVPSRAIRADCVAMQLKAVDEALAFLERARAESTTEQQVPATSMSGNEGAQAAPVGKTGTEVQGEGSVATAQEGQ
jgi:hypothetical protein